MRIELYLLEGEKLVCSGCGMPQVGVAAVGVGPTLVYIGSTEEDGQRNAVLCASCIDIEESAIAEGEDPVFPSDPK